MAKHADDDPVMYGYASSRNVSMCSQPGGEELGYTWGEWRELSQEARDRELQDAINGLIEVWIEDNEG